MIGCIIQARMSSSRLPGKVMMKMDKKNTVLDYVIKQLSSSKSINKIIVATTVSEEDNIIENHIRDLSIDCFRGDKLDVLDRYYQCAKSYSVSTIVRVTSDCPLIDPVVVDDAIYRFQSGSYDYVTNSLDRTYPYGTDVEVFSFPILETCWKNAKKLSEREHVTSYIYNNKNKFKIFMMRYNQDFSKLKLAVDREKDLQLVRMIAQQIKHRPILLNDIATLVEKNFQLFSINSDYAPNEGYLKSLKEDKSEN